jgi:hypothetical protein
MAVCKTNVVHRLLLLMDLTQEQLPSSTQVGQHQSSFQIAEFEKLTTMRLYVTFFSTVEQTTCSIQTKLIFDHETADLIMHSAPYISGNGVTGIFIHTRPYLLLMELMVTELSISRSPSTASNYSATQLFMEFPAIMGFRSSNSSHKIGT